jgi:hypothetical protein
VCLECGFAPNPAPPFADALTAGLAPTPPDAELNSAIRALPDHFNLGFFLKFGVGAASG